MLYRSFLLVSAAVSAASMELRGTIGRSITIPDVVDFGTLKHNGTDVMLVHNNTADSYSNKTNKYQWNNSTGRFTITHLEKTDAGNLTITFSNRTVTYQLTIHDSVECPTVLRLNVSSDSCYLLCAVDKAAEITLWWYKDQEVVNQSSSAGSLPLTVTKQDLSSSYRCVAGNPAENQTVAVDLQEVCGENFTSSSSENNHGPAPPAGNNTNSSSENNYSDVFCLTGWIMFGVFAVLLFASLVALAVLIWRKRCRENDNNHRGPERVRYVRGNGFPDSQNQGGGEEGSSDSHEVMLQEE